MSFLTKRFSKRVYTCKLTTAVKPMFSPVQCVSDVILYNSIRFNQDTLISLMIIVCMCYVGKVQWGWNPWTFFEVGSTCLCRYYHSRNSWAIVQRILGPESIMHAGTRKIPNTVRELLERVHVRLIYGYFLM